MSIMSDLADEVLKPVKTGLFITSAVIVVGGVAIAANSKSGRKFLGKVKDAATATKPTEDKGKSTDSVVIDVDAEPATQAIEEKKTETKLIGEQNV